MKFITGGFVVGLSSKKKKGSSAEREREDLPRSEEARGVVQCAGLYPSPVHIYTLPALWHSILKNPEGCNCVRTTCRVLAGRGLSNPFTDVTNNAVCVKGVSMPCFECAEKNCHCTSFFLGFPVSLLQSRKILLCLGCVLSFYLHLTVVKMKLINFKFSQKAEKVSLLSGRN